LIYFLIIVLFDITIIASLLPKSNKITKKPIKKLRKRNFCVDIQLFGAIIKSRVAKTQQNIKRHEGRRKNEQTNELQNKEPDGIAGSIQL
jgi:hypothetical protein